MFHDKVDTKDNSFWTEEGIPVQTVTAEQMREVDRIAMQIFNIDILQMMENAGRSLCENVIEILGKTGGAVTIMAGAGGNGGGGLSCARHLHNHGFCVDLILDHDPAELNGAVADQFQILHTTGFRSMFPSEEQDTIRCADIVVDALIGYSLHRAPYGKTEKLIKLCNEYATKVISLDVPSGLDATTGEAMGVIIRSDRTMTLALPKTGLLSTSDEIFVADIGIPLELYRSMGMDLEQLFTGKYSRRLLRRRSKV